MHSLFVTSHLSGCLASNKKRVLPDDTTKNSPKTSGILASMKVLIPLGLTSPPSSMNRLIWLG